MNVKGTMERSGVVHLSETETEPKGSYKDPVRESILVYGILRKHGVSGYEGYAVARNWPEGGPVAVRWRSDVHQVMNTEKNDKAKTATPKAGSMIMGDEVEILDIEGGLEDVRAFRKKLDLLEKGYSPTTIPIYAPKKMNEQNQPVYVLDGNVTMYLTGEVKGDVLPLKGTATELLERLAEPFVLMETPEKSFGSTWHLGQKKAN